MKLHLHDKAFKRKPTGREIPQINNEITNTIVNIGAKELAKELSKGKTAVLATMNGKRSKDNIIQQQVVALDFDDGKTTIAEVLEDTFILNNASFLYKTFSYTEEQERFRVVFILDEPLKNNSEVFGAYQYLFEKFPHADKATKDSSRIFFGGTEAIEINYDNKLKVSKIPKIEVEEYIPNREIQYTQYDVSVLGAYDYDTPTWMLLKAGETKEVKRRWSQYSKGLKFEGPTEVWNFARSLDMKELLGVQGNPFLNVLEYEENPSASIWKPENSNTYLYTELNKQGKNGRSRSYDIYKIVSKLTGMSVMGAEQYMIEAFDADFTISKELEQIYKEADMFKRILLSDSFKEEHPEMYQMYGRYGYQTKINALIDIFKGQLYENEAGKIEMLTWMSDENIAKRLGMSKRSAQRLINMLTLTRVIDKLPEGQIPHRLLKIIKKNQTHVKNDRGEWVKRNTQRQYRATVMKLNPLMEGWEDTEEECKVQVDNGFTMKGLSMEYVLRTSGRAEADRVYPQDTERTISTKSREITTVIHSTVMEEVEENGFVIINEVKNKVQERYGSKGFTDYKYKQAEAEMIEGYGLKKIGLTNDLKEEYNITHLSPYARPKILVLDY